MGASWRSAGLPRGARFWVVSALVAASVPLAMYLPPLSRALHVGKLSGLQWLGALSSAFVAVAVLGEAARAAARRIGFSGTEPPRTGAIRESESS